MGTPISASLTPLQCCIWAPLAATANRNLPVELAGAGSGVFLTVRQTGFALGTAAIGALLSSGIAAQGLPAGSIRQGGGSAGRDVPPADLQKISTALGESMYLPALVLLIGMIAAVLFISTPCPAAAPEAVKAGESR